MRPSARSRNELREVKITRKYIKYAEGSVLIEFGNTHVLCNASVVPGVPRFLKGSNQGWLTAEYSMLPRSTKDRMQREGRGNTISGRTQEIQRLIGRSLRAAVNLKLLGENTITIDCDVIQADGGTRTAAITGGCVALVDALGYMKKRGLVKKDPLKYLITAVSVGIYKEFAVLDLDYIEDSNAATDMNVIMTERGDFIEVQGTAEAAPFSNQQMQDMLALAKTGVLQLAQKQREALELA